MTTLHIRQGDARNGGFHIRLTAKRSGQPDQEAEANIQFALTESEQENLRWYLVMRHAEAPLLVVNSSSKPE